MKDAAISIVKKLRQEGYSAYFAGGCVRDQLMGIPPKDYDVATNARPRQVIGSSHRLSQSAPNLVSFW